MSMEKIYGKWEDVRQDKADLPRWLFGRLAAQKDAPNSGLSQRPNEFLELCYLFQRVNPNIVLEIGTSQGGSFAAWCQLARSDALLISIDRCIDDCRPRPGDPVHPDIYSGPLKMASQGGGAKHLARYGQQVHAINGWSYEPHVLKQLEFILQGRKIDFCFHDASHSKEMFARDWQIYWPLVAEGGVFASHDVAWSSDPNCDKSLEWARILKEETYSAAYHYMPHPSVTEMGIGVIVK